MHEVKDISCEQAISQLLEYLDQECSEHSHHEIDKHLAVCQACYSRMEFEQRLRSQLKESGRQQAPASLRGRIDALFSTAAKK